MKNTCKFVTLTIPALIAMSSIASAATLVDFEGATGQTSFSNATPYVSGDFTFTPSSSANISDATVSDMRGDGTDWLNFTQDNTITITNGSTFSLIALDLGPLNDSAMPGSVANFQFFGYDADDNLINSAFVGGVNSKQSVELSEYWTNFDLGNMTTITINFTTDNNASPIAGIDNVSLVTTVPEPSAALLGGLGALALLRRRRN